MPGRRTAKAHGNDTNAEIKRGRKDLRLVNVVWICVYFFLFPVGTSEFHPPLPAPFFKQISHSENCTGLMWCIRERSKMVWGIVLGLDGKAETTSFKTEGIQCRGVVSQAVKGWGCKQWAVKQP